MAEQGVELKITADAKGAQQGIDQASQALDGLGQAAQQAGQHAGQAAEQVGKVGANTGGIDAAERATSRFGRTTDWLRDKWQATAGTIRDFAVGNLLAQAFMGIAQRATELARAFIAANEQVAGLRRAFGAIYKDAALAERQIAFLRETSNAAGVGFDGLSSSFKSFTAAATAANIPLAVQNDLFASVAKAGATLGLSTAETSRAVLALSQMASKGTVSMEELRQQLGESLPGALSLAAKGLGLTEAELIKLVESGGLAARDLFPALAQSLKTMAGENNTLTGTWERLRNAMAQAFAAAGDGGGMQALIAGARALAGAVGLVLVPLQGFAEALFGLGRAIGAGAAALAVLTDKGTTWAQKAALLKDIGGDLGDSMAAAGGRISATAGAFTDAALGADKAAAGMGGLKGAADQSTAAAAQLSQSWVSVGQTMGKAAADMAQQAANAGKHAQAVKDQGAALVELARVQGEHGAILQAEQQAAAANATALEAVAQARAKELEIVTAELTAKQNLIAGNEAEQKAREQDIKGLSDKVAKLTEEAGAARQSAEAAKNAALAKQAAAEADRNHAGQLAELTLKLKDQRTALEQVRAEYEAGRATREQVAGAERQVALAAANVRDAFADQTEAARASAIAKKADADSAVSLLQTQKQLAAQGEEMARLMGDENLARHYRIEQMQIDVKITLAKADAMRVEAEGSINVARAKLEELRAKGQLTKVNEAELNASIKIAEAKIKEAAATKDLAGLLQNGVDAARNYGDAAGRAGDKSRGATDKAAEGWRDVASDARDAAKAAGEYQEKLGEGVQRVGGGFRNKDGWASDAKGNAITAREDPALRNQRLAAMFGEDMIGNQNAEAAYNLRNRIALLERYSDPTAGDGSLGLLKKNWNA
ncbi:tape measure protein [Ottowia pentelensis]|uniref:tape measure protein n=1 Tax=Ottowia pentelensis TaxID=511108 RepID=UPI003629DF94